MLSIKDNNISLTRGDTAYLELSIKDYYFRIGDIIELSVKKTVKDAEHFLKKIIQVENVTETITIKIEPQDTNNASFSEYIYDIQLTTADGDVNTVIPAHKFNITKEVS